MRVILEVDPEKYSKIRRLTEERRYESVAQFIDTAIENQLHLESISPIEKGLSSNSALRNDFEIPSKIWEDSNFPTHLSEYSSIIPVDEPDPRVLESDYLWMMNNRYLPIKLALRSIASCLSHGSASKQWTELSIAHDVAAKAAVRTGRSLESKDSQRRSNRERHAIGFPSDRDEKSQSRFKWFCVGILKPNGAIVGAPGTLRFANIIKNGDGHPVIGLTEAGLAFAQLKNPVLDFGGTTNPLSPEETEFLWSHVSRVLPKERSLMLRVLEYISQGRNTPNALTEPVKSILGKNLTETISHRASLVSRLAEMGLLIRKKQGLHVTYHLTDHGKRVLTPEGPQVKAAR